MIAAAFPPFCVPRQDLLNLLPNQMAPGTLQAGDISPCKMAGGSGSPVKADCQWFVMSPRPSLESPEKRLFFDEDDNEENAVPNVVKRRVSEQEEKGAVRVPKTKSHLANSASCVSPLGARQPQSARATGGRDQVLPCTNQRAALTSRTHRGGSANQKHTPDARGYDELSTSVCNMSMSSEHSCSSRLSQLSRRATTRQHLSTDELIQQEMEEKKRELARLAKRNQTNCAKVRHPNPVHAASSVRRSTRVTVPNEFNLGVRTPGEKKKEPRTSDGEDSIGSASVGSTRTPRKACFPAAAVTSCVPRRQSMRQLTVPRGPSCLERPSKRHSVSCPPQDVDEDGRSEVSVNSTRSEKYPSASSRVAARRVSKEFQHARASTPERRSEALQSETPKQKISQLVRASTPERRTVDPALQATPEARISKPVPLETLDRHGNFTEQEPRVERARRLIEKAERNRQEAQQKANQEAEQRRRRTVFQKFQHTSSQTQAAKVSDVSTGGSSVGSAKGTSAVIQRRPSFGSTASRFGSAPTKR